MLGLAVLRRKGWLWREMCAEYGTVLGECVPNCAHVVVLNSAPLSLCFSSRR